MTISDIEKLLAPKELEQVLGLRRSKIHRMLSTGEISSLIVAQGSRRRVFRVRPSALAAWMKQREVRND